MCGTWWPIVRRHASDLKLDWPPQVLGLLPMHGYLVPWATVVYLNTVYQNDIRSRSSSITSISLVLRIHSFATSLGFYETICISRSTWSLQSVNVLYTKKFLTYSIYILRGWHHWLREADTAEGCLIMCSKEDQSEESQQILITEIVIFDLWWIKLTLTR